MQRYYGNTRVWNSLKMMYYAAQVNINLKYILESLYRAFY